MQLNLLIDADDTLWENNIYFERAFEEFVDFLDHSTLSPADSPRGARRDRDRQQQDPRLWLGRTSPGTCSSATCIWRSGRSGPKISTQVMSFGERLLDHPMEMIEGVEETLRYLRERHDSDSVHQRASRRAALKIDRSGLECYFHHTAIVKEKDAAAYRKLVSDLRSGSRPDLDDRQLAEIRREPALEAGLERRLHPSRPHLDPRARRDPGS